MRELKLKPKDFYVYQYKGNNYFYSDCTVPQITKLRDESYQKFINYKETGEADIFVEDFVSERYRDNIEKGLIFEGKPAFDKDLTLGIQLAFNNKCPMNCSYCFSHSEEFKNKFNNEKDKKITKKLLKDIFDFFLKRFPNSQLFNYSFNITGEPLADFKTLKMFNKLQKKYEKKTNKFFPQGALTNGLLLDDKIINWLNKNVPFTGVSFDGTREAQDENRKINNIESSYDRILPNIKKLLSKNWFIPLGVSVTITSKNLDIKKLFLHLIDDIGFKVISMKIVRLEEDKDEIISKNNIDVFFDRFQEFVDFILDKTLKGEYRYIKAILNTFDEFGYTLIRILGNMTSNSCGGGFWTFGVDINGDIYPCATFTYLKEFKLGNIYTGFDNAIFNKLLSGTKDHITQCKECEFNRYCKTACMYRSLINDGAISKPDEINCAIQKEFIKLGIYFWSEIFIQNKVALDELIPYIQKLFQKGKDN